VVLDRFVKKLSKNSRVLFLAHAGADVDSIASAFALSDSLPVAGTVGYPDHCNRNALQLVQSLSIKTLKNPVLDRFDAVVLVDFHSFSHAGSLSDSLREYEKPILVLDHHEKDSKDLIKTPFLSCEPESVSASVVVFNELQKAKIVPSKKALLAIAAGIMSDSALLHRANAEALQVLAVCLQKTKSDFNSIPELFSVKEDLSERIAKLHSARRMRLVEVNGFLVALSHVNYFESEAAAALVTLGADVAFVAGVEHDSELLRLNARCGNEFLAQTRVNLGRLVLQLPSFFGGHGSGHQGAAGFNAFHADPQVVLQKALELLILDLKGKGEIAIKEIVS